MIIHRPTTLAGGSSCGNTAKKIKGDAPVTGDQERVSEGESGEGNDDEKVRKIEANVEG